MKGLSENCKNFCSRYGIQIHFKGGSTIKNLLVKPKDRDTIWQKVGWYTDMSVHCEDENIGELSRTFAERYKEHMKAPSPIHDHDNTTGHNISTNNFSIVGREDHNLARSIKEAILIRVNGLSHNRNIGKYQLPHIWDEVLMKSPEIMLKYKSITSRLGVI